MESPFKILIVEDEMLIGANISLQLSKLGYHITGVVPRGEEALEQIKIERPDIVLLDIQLKGKLDGIETAVHIQREFGIPVIYLTANADEAHFERAKATNPYAFISKPFKKSDLQYAVQLAADRILLESNVAAIGTAEPFVLTDCIFVKDHEKMTKIFISDIFYIEADRNYCRIFSKDREYLLVMTLKDMDEKLPRQHFQRIHRSYVINLSQVDEVAQDHVVISKKILPLSKLFRNDLLKRLQTI
ncbi:N/A [soil metagenome]